MSTTTKTSTSTATTEIVIVHEADLDRPRERGGRMRAFCPIHGGDHQRSLSIALDGDAQGYGYCHTCHTRVYVPELAPPGARGPSAARVRRVPRAEELLRPAKPRRAASAPEPERWQHEELATLQRLQERMWARLASDERPRAYLAGRGIPYEVAAAAGVGYIPADAKLSGALAKWRDRLIFPLGSPSGAGFAGRSLHGWQPGMDEDAHKALLDGLGGAQHSGPRRWEKTYPAGWFGYDALATAERVILCEGPLDRLAIMVAQFDAEDVVALVGTAAPPAWIPVSVRGVVLALDGDAAGRERAEALRHALRQAGFGVVPCVPPSEDGCGKDWSARWRIAKWEGVAPIFAAHQTLTDLTSDD